MFTQSCLSQSLCSNIKPSNLNEAWTDSWELSTVTDRSFMTKSKIQQPYFYISR